jgi:hypothetical protein
MANTSPSSRRPPNPSLGYRSLNLEVLIHILMLLNHLKTLLLSETHQGLHLVYGFNEDSIILLDAFEIQYYEIGC